MINRRDFLKLTAAAGAGIALPSVKSGKLGGVQRALAEPAAPGIGLSDPAIQPRFTEYAPNALNPGFKFTSPNGKFKVAAMPSMQQTGLVDDLGNKLWTPVWGYGENGRTPTWPGKTFEVQSGVPIEVMWQNKLGPGHLLPVDTSLHWAYSLHGYEGVTVASVVIDEGDRVLPSVAVP